MTFIRQNVFFITLNHIMSLYRDQLRDELIDERNFCKSCIYCLLMFIDSITGFFSKFKTNFDYKILQRLPYSCDVKIQITFLYSFIVIYNYIVFMLPISWLLMQLWLAQYCLNLLSVSFLSRDDHCCRVDLQEWQLQRCLKKELQKDSTSMRIVKVTWTDIETVLLKGTRILNKLMN